jgi:hypothetical protein
LADKGLPQFGVCLGLQGIVEAFGGSLAVMPLPRHGKRWSVTHDKSALFAGLPNPCVVGAYHSLAAINANFPDVLRKTAWTDDTDCRSAVSSRVDPVDARGWRSPVGAQCAWVANECWAHGGLGGETGDGRPLRLAHGFTHYPPAI